MRAENAARCAAGGKQHATTRARNEDGSSHDDSDDVRSPPITLASEGEDPGDDSDSEDATPPLTSTSDSSSEEESGSEDEDEKSDAEPAARPPARPAGERYSRRLQGEEADNEQLHLARAVRQINALAEMQWLTAGEAMFMPETEAGRTKAQVCCIKQREEGWRLNELDANTTQPTLCTLKTAETTSEKRVERSEKTDEEILRESLAAAPITQNGEALTEEQILADETNS